MNCPYLLMALPTECVVRKGNSVVAVYHGSTGRKVVAMTSKVNNGSGLGTTQ